MTISTNHHSKSFEGKSAWQAPSNIALVKYWGKHGDQLPCNPSLSFTLDRSHTKTQLKWQQSKETLSDISLEFYFHGKKEESFTQRMKKFLNKLAKNEMPFLFNYNLCIESENSFPHSAGIASSASAMASLALCLCDMESEVTGKTSSGAEYFSRASHIARLGSGSASRSLYPFMAWWGESHALAGSSDEKALEIDNIGDCFKTYHDSILIISSDKKSVSSSVGHQLMENNEMAPIRFKKAAQNCKVALDYIANEEMDKLGEIIEAEALELHALMMTSTPSFILMKPGTLAVIEKIRAYREKTQNPVYFTLDAGPNVHILYPDSIKTEVQEFINQELLQFAEDEKVIHDFVGKGPVKLHE